MSHLFFLGGGRRYLISYIEKEIKLDTIRHALRIVFNDLDENFICWNDISVPFLYSGWPWNFLINLA